jgi:hypothetical protein
MAHGSDVVCALSCCNFVKYIYVVLTALRVKNSTRVCQHFVVLFLMSYRFVGVLDDVINDGA